MNHIRLRLRHALGLVLVVARGGCSRISPPRPVGDLNCEVYDHGRPFKSVVLKESEPDWNEVVGIASSKQEHWDTAPIDFAPVVLVRSENVSLNLQDGHVVANFVDAKGKPRQVIATLAKDEYAHVREKFDSYAAKGGPASTRR